MNKIGKINLIAKLVIYEEKHTNKLWEDCECDNCGRGYPEVFGNKKKVYVLRFNASGNSLYLCKECFDKQRNS